MALSADATDNSELLSRLRASDKEAFRLLFERYQPILFRNILYSVRNPDTAHDVVQETFVRLWNHRTTVKPNQPLLAYLFRISRNLVLDTVKRAEVRQRLEREVQEMLQSAEVSPEESAHAGMLEERLSEVIRTKLPAKCREVFLLSRMEGLSNSEISRQLEISKKTVENQISRALKVLRKHLRAFGASGH